MRQLFHNLLLITALLVSGSAWAATLTGKVVNGTTNKPAAGDEVVLLTLSSAGMNETERVKTDSAGRFLFQTDSVGSCVVRAIHQGVTYHSVVRPGSARVKVRVYDVAERVEGVAAVMDVQRFEATGGTLEIKQLVTMRNQSEPPRTLMNNRSFEIQLPPEAQVQSGLVQFEDGPPLKQNPVAGDQKGHYYFAFPIRPGDTRFAVVYRQPYSGETVIEPQIRNPLEKFVVMLPKSMTFRPKAAGVFQAMTGTTPDNVQGTAPLNPGQVVAFRISGTGMLQELEGRGKEAQRGNADASTRPGGGLAPPIEAPDPLQKYRWPILAGVTVLMGMGAVYVLKKTRLPRGEKSDRIGLRVSRRVVKKQITGRRVNRRHRQHTRA